MNGKMPVKLWSGPKDTKHKPDCASFYRPYHSEGAYPCTCSADKPTPPAPTLITCKVCGASWMSNYMPKCCCVETPAPAEAELALVREWARGRCECCGRKVEGYVPTQQRLFGCKRICRNNVDWTPAWAKGD